VASTLLIHPESGIVRIAQQDHASMAATTRRSVFPGYKTNFASEKRHAVTLRLPYQRNLRRLSRLWRKQPENKKGEK
jgi:hypothetical protein